MEVRVMNPARHVRDLLQSAAPMRAAFCCGAGVPVLLRKLDQRHRPWYGASDDERALQPARTITHFAAGNAFRATDAQTGECLVVLEFAARLRWASPKYQRLQPLFVGLEEFLKLAAVGRGQRVLADDDRGNRSRRAVPVRSQHLARIVPATGGKVRAIGVVYQLNWLSV